MKDEAISRVRSNQSDIHEDLLITVKKHLQSTWQEPIPEHTRVAADEIISLVNSHTGPLILDSFCGTGMSTAKLAKQFPEALVIGIDKSQDRLSKHVVGNTGNYHLFRASCEHTWAALAQAGVRCHRHFLLYPNPWPKKSHLKRRIHGHPAFPLLRALGGMVTLRSNWLTYVKEFSASMTLLNYRSEVSEIKPTDPLTLFERKYSANKENLWQCEAIAVEDAGEDPQD
jgi:tRNA (guanine-N7-)-methyltransferase